MKVSVVIPTCDRALLLKECVRSVLDQSYSPHEIIIIDNGKEHVQGEMLPDIDLIKLKRCLPKFGVSQARNFGGLYAAGDLIAFLDDDDLWHKDYLKNVVSHYEMSGSDIVLGNLMSLSSGLPLPGKQPNFKNNDELIGQILTRNPGITGSNTVINRLLFHNSKGYDPYLTTGQDKALILDCLLANASLSVADKALVYFREDTAGPRQTLKKKLVEGKQRFLLKYWLVMKIKHRFVNFFSILRIALLWKI
jgi:glycosyltransferase involved in cell wall biosynthesis